MRSGAFKSNSEPYPDWLAGNLIFSVIKAASPSPRSLESPRDLLLRAQEGREGRASQRTGHTLSFSSNTTQASDLGVTTT